MSRCRRPPSRSSGSPRSPRGALWNEAAKHHDERGLAGLVIAIATINVWNRFNLMTRQIVGSVKW